jgi:hypothetical protein
MAEAVIAEVEAVEAGRAGGPEREGWLTLARRIIDAVDRGERVDDLIEEGYRHLLFSRSEAVRRNPAPTTSEEMERMIVFRLPEEIKERLG